ncbi:LysR family transcriptional regulator [Sinorhizobium sp. BJ1]|uniref:LysR family transcriptional regulator n=1 Tax=Sinorhizobium sp. BJ1 TaxID=2035455 RepID=UPI0006151D79|nr:LysR family transcriptional regulator [Sinorhizobium sp. BJ1]PDT82206.1 LysR family transcriptional regulator [Sinorhizobium sp. BJ1]
MQLSRTTLGDLTVFVALARHGGFRKAALDLDVSASALSHAMRGLEARLGVRLINRNARSVTLTEAGEELLARLEAGFGEISEGLEALNRFRESPAGRLRINVLSDAARLVLGPVLAEYTRIHPDVHVEIIVQDEMVDIVAGGYDAGIRFGGRVPEDMIAMPIGPPLRWVMVASASYLEEKGMPANPEALRDHRCIGFRMGTGAIYRWELERGSEVLAMDLQWSIVVSETDVALSIARSGGGIVYCIADRVQPLLDDGSLREVLPDWSSEGEPFYIYYSSRRQQPEALRALVAMLRRGTSISD